MLENTSKKEETYMMPTYFAPKDIHKELIQYIRSLCFSYDNEITLASGKKSNFYFNMKPLMMDSKSLKMAVSILIKKMPSDTQYIGGLEVGSIPLTTGILALKEEKHPWKGFFIRKEAKKHGLGKRIEGLAKDDLLKGKKITLIEDITTTGTSALNAASVVREYGGRVSHILTLLDREEGAIENMKKSNIEFIACFKASDVMKNDMAI